MNYKTLKNKEDVCGHNTSCISPSCLLLNIASVLRTVLSQHIFPYLHVYCLFSLSVSCVYTLFNHFHPVCVFLQSEMTLFLPLDALRIVQLLSLATNKLTIKQFP